MTQYDLVLTLGGLVGLLAIPSIMAAFAEVRAPRAGAIGFVAGACLVIYALTQKPGGYTLEEAIDAPLHVVAAILR